MIITGPRQKTRVERAFFAGIVFVFSDQAACLCMAPDEEAEPRIALTERSIAAHSLLISAAARPSAEYSRAPGIYQLPVLANARQQLGRCSHHHRNSTGLPQ